MKDLAKLIAIKTYINLGLLSKLKAAFPNIIPALGMVINKNIPDP